MPKLPVVTGDEVVSALKKAGFVTVHTRGSHVRMKSPDGERVTVPIHAGRSVAPGTLHQIIKQAGLTPEQFAGLLK